MISPAERQEVRDLANRLGGVSRRVSTAWPNSYDSQHARRGERAAALLARVLEALEACEAERDGLRHAQATLRCEIEELERAREDLRRDVADAEASFLAACFEREEARRDRDRYCAALEASEREVARRDVMIERFMGVHDGTFCASCLTRIEEAERGPFVPLDEAFADIRAHLQAVRQQDDQVLAEDRADYFSSLDGGRKEGES